MRRRSERFDFPVGLSRNQTPRTASEFSRHDGYRPLCKRDLSRRSNEEIAMRTLVSLIVAAGLSGLGVGAAIGQNVKPQEPDKAQQET